MRSKINLRTLWISVVLVIALFLFGGFGTAHHFVANASRADAYDLSEWQGHINNRQARGLKNEVSFVILRAQNGSAYQDRQFQNSADKLTQNGVPYGVYSYSLYHNNQQARNEASTLYNRAPQASFYVNDIEQNNAGRRIASATKSWATQMKALTTKPIVLYSSMSFIQRYLRPVRKHYNAVWVAAYSKQRPVTGYKYDLWQYSSRHYSKALGKRIDASKLTGHKPLSFWIGSNGNDAVVQPVKPVAQKPKHVKLTASVARSTRGLAMKPRALKKYHHEMKKVTRKLLRGDHHMSRKERKALKIYKLRHGRDFQIDYF